MAYGLGVDVGTVFTTAAIARSPGRAEVVLLGERAASVPSVVFAGADGVLVAGELAALRARSEPGRAAREVKRRLGDPTPLVLGGAPYAPTALLAAVVRNVVDTVTAAEGSAPARVVLSYPASWGPYRREDFAEVALLSGIEDAITVPEPVAAAACYPDDQVVLLYDLGGGTFDAAVVRGDTLLGEPQGIDPAGGEPFDAAVYSYVDELTGRAASALDPAGPAAVLLWRDCRLAKEALSRRAQAAIPVWGTGGYTEVTLSRAELERRIAPLVDATVEATQAALRSANVQPDALVLAGGSVRIPLVAERLTAEFNGPIRIGRHPEHTVALGAARIAAAGLGATETAAPAAAAAPRRRVLLAAAVAVLVGAAAYSVGRATAPGSVPAAAPATTTPAPARAPAGVVAPSLAVPSVRTTITGVGVRPQGVAITPDGSQVWVPSSVSGTVSIIDAATDRISGSVTVPQPPQYVAISPDGTRAYVTLNDPARKVNDVVVVAVATREVAATIPVGHTLYTLAISPDGGTLFVPDHASSRVFAVDTVTNHVIGSFGVPVAPHGAAFTTNGNQAYVVSHESSEVSVVDVEHRTITDILSVGASPAGIALAPDGRSLLTANYDADAVSIVDTARADEVATVQVGLSPLAAAYAPDGRHAYVLNSNSGTVSVLDTATNRVTATIPTGDTPWSVAVTRDGRRAYVTNAVSNTVTVLQTAS